jgi:hypothetical protein
MCEAPYKSMSIRCRTKMLQIAHSIGTAPYIRGMESHEGWFSDFRIIRRTQPKPSMQRCVGDRLNGREMLEGMTTVDRSSCVS